MTAHLWINATDLMYPALQIPLVGSVVNLLISTELGDRRLDGTYYKPGGRIDDMFTVFECTDRERAQAIVTALELIGKEKVGHKIRTRTTAGPPTSAWLRR